MATVPYPRRNTVNSAAGTEPSADTQAPPDNTPAPGATSTALLRAYRPATGDHFYTTSVAEKDNAVAADGYVDEGVACQVYPN